ncbi:MULTISPECIES: hypothetical protein [unclassified Microcoleus]
MSAAAGRSRLSNLLSSMQRSWIEGVQVSFGKLGELGELGEVED